MSSDVTAEPGAEVVAGVTLASWPAFFGWAHPGKSATRRATGSTTRGEKAVMGTPRVRERNGVPTIYVEKGSAHVDAPLGRPPRTPGAARHRRHRRRRRCRPGAASRRLPRWPQRGHGTGP